MKIDFLWNVDCVHDERKTAFCYAIPYKPFKILIEIVNFFKNRSLQSAKSLNTCPICKTENTIKRNI